MGLESFGCCSRYQECSDNGACLYPTIEDYKGCLYNKNLVKGIVFYGKNANNKKISNNNEDCNDNGLKHVGEVLKDVVKDVVGAGEIVDIKTPVSENKIYLDCFDRNFNVGRYDVKRGYTYGLTSEEFELISNVFLENNIPFVTTTDSNKCLMEGNANEPAIAKVFINIPGCDTTFRIGNYNSCYILRRYAEGIKRAFERKGIPTKLEVKEYRRTYVSSEQTPKQDPENKERSIQDSKNTIVKQQSYKQISMFEMV